MKIFDTHAHYDDEAFSEDRESLLSSVHENDVALITNIGASMESSKTTLELANSHDFMYAAVGVHPNEVAELTEKDMDILVGYVKENPKKVVAIGEIGLEYHYEEPDRDTQRYWFRRQLKLAKEVGLPVVIHSREAAEETYKIMKEEKAEELGGVVHCYSYSPELAAEFVKMGFYIGIGGVLTFKNGRKLKEVAERIPLDRIVLETDCPYMAPVPYRGKRNDSAKLHEVVKVLAEMKGLSEEEIADITFENGKKMYRISE